MRCRSCGHDPARLKTLEVECASCHELRWPRLASRPTTYICIRCASVPDGKRAARAEQAGRAAKTRQKARRDTTRAV